MFSYDAWTAAGHSHMLCRMAGGCFACGDIHLELNLDAS